VPHVASHANAHAVSHAHANARAHRQAEHAPASPFEELLEDVAVEADQPTPPQAGELAVALQPAQADGDGKTAKPQADPENATTYQANGADMMKRLDALDTELKTTLEPVKDKPFIVFHDAYQYFENRYGVKVAGSITVSPESIPGAERVKEIHQKVEELGATCVFAEPQFEPKLVKVVTEGSKARSGVLDPEAGALTEGPDLYFDLMRGLATSLKTCLSQAS